MISVTVSEEIRAACPGFVGAALEAEFANTEYSARLWEEISAIKAECCRKFTAETLKKHPPIEATRKIYKRFGKDPSRYRPSAEALIRRMLRGMDLYRINTAVDLINLASISFGYSIGGFDADKISGDVVLGVGRDGEPYEGIGRGALNIAGMPVYRDEAGGIGTPTSDNERTKIELTTTHLLSLVNGYDGDEKNVVACAEYMQELLRKFGNSDGGRVYIYK